MGWAVLSDLKLRQARNEHLRFHSWRLILTMWSGLVQTEKRKNEHDDDDQADEINDSIHVCLRTSRPNIGVNQFLTFARFRSSRGTTSRSPNRPKGAFAIF